jgi:hypothetical protein
MTDLTHDPAPLGHNRAPTYEEELRLEHKALFLRLEALKLEREKLPAIANSDADNTALGRFVVNCRDLIKDVDAAHKTVSQPWKEKATTCDKVFLTRGLIGEVDSLRAVVQALADDFAARKERERRRQLEEEAERIRAEADAKAYEAEALKDAGSHSAAEVLESQSEHAERHAARLESKADGAPAAVLRTHADGVTASGREKWAFEILDADKIDLNALRDAIYGHELAQIIQRFVDGGGRELPGVRIYAKTIATFRR